MGFSFTDGYGLVDLVQDVREATDDALPEMAERAGSLMRDVAVERTPVDTGRTRESFYMKPVVMRVRDGAATYETGVASDYFVAALLEHGTHPHEIEGRPVEFRDPHTGEAVFARRVEHPGTPGTHAVAIAAATTEAQFEALVEPVVRRWRREAEQRRRR